MVSACILLWSNCWLTFSEHLHPPRPMCTPQWSCVHVWLVVHMCETLQARVNISVQVWSAQDCIYVEDWNIIEILEKNAYTCILPNFIGLYWQFKSVVACIICMLPQPLREYEGLSRLAYENYFCTQNISQTWLYNQQSFWQHQCHAHFSI